MTVWQNSKIKTKIKQLLSLSLQSLISVVIATPPPFSLMRKRMWQGNWQHFRVCVKANNCLIEPCHMLILIKFNAEIFQQRKRIQSICVSLRGTIYGILAVCDWLLLGQALCNAVTLRDYFLFSFGNYKLQQCSLGTLSAEPVCAGQQRSYQQSTSRRARPLLLPPSQPAHARDKQANATTSASKSNWLLLN